MDVLDLARRDPDTLLGGEQHITLDEVQREPDLLNAVKRAIDRHREPGKFLLTGSANLLLMQRVSESLAGRGELPDVMANDAQRAGRLGPMRNLGATACRAGHGLAGHSSQAG